MALPGYKTYSDFANVVLGDSRMGRSPKPFNAIFFDQETLGEVYDPECCTEAGIVAFAELLVRYLFNPDAKTIIVEGCSRNIVRRIRTIVQCHENMPGVWKRICPEIHNLDDDDFDWPAYRGAVEKRLEYLLNADGFIPVFIEGQDSAAYFIPFRFVSKSTIDESGDTRVFSLDGEALENSSWNDELKLLPETITEDIQLGISPDAWRFTGSSLLLPIMIAWWRKKGKLHRYNHLRVMATGRFDKDARLQEVDVPAKERAFVMGVKGGCLIRPGNGGTACEIGIGASVQEVLDRVRNLTCHTANSMLNVLETRWLDRVSAYRGLSTAGIGCRVIERIMALRKNAWCAVVDSSVFKIEGRLTDGGLSFLKTILGFSNSSTGGFILVKIPKGMTRENVLHIVEELLQDAKDGFVDGNGHHWYCRRDHLDELPRWKEDIACHQSYGPRDEVLVLTVAPSKRPYVLHRECSATCMNGGTIPLVCMSVCKRTEGENPNGEWSIPDLLESWGDEGVLTHMDALGDVLDEDERLFDGDLFASVERIRQQGWSLASGIWSELSKNSCMGIREDVRKWENERRLVLLETEDANADMRRLAAAGILLNDLRLHKWGTPVPVIVRIDQDDVGDWNGLARTPEELLIQLLGRNYPAGEFPVRVWRRLISMRLLALVVFGEEVEVSVEPELNRPIQKMVEHLLCVVGNEILWVGDIPNEIRNSSVCLDAYTLNEFTKEEQNDTDNHP